MPLYEYNCGRCKRYFEYLHVNSQDKAECPYCGSSDAKKRPSAPHGIVNGASAKNNYGLKPGRKK